MMLVNWAPNPGCALCPVDDESIVSRVHLTMAATSNSYPPGIDTCRVMGVPTRGML